MSTKKRNGTRTPKTQRALGLAMAIVAATSWFVITAPVSAQTTTDLGQRQQANVSEFRGQGYKKVYMTLTMTNVPDPSDTFAFTVSCLDVAPRTLSWPDDIYFGNIFNDGETYYLMTAPDVADAECTMAIIAPPEWECGYDTYRSLGKLTFHAGCSNPANEPSVTTLPPWPTEDTAGDRTTTTLPRPQTTTTMPLPRTTPETIEW